MDSVTVHILQPLPPSLLSVVQSSVMCGGMHNLLQDLKKQKRDAVRKNIWTKFSRFSHASIRYNNQLHPIPPTYTHPITPTYNIL